VGGLIVIGNQLKEIAGLGISPCTEHPHQAFRRATESLSGLNKPDGPVDIFAKNRFGGIQIARQHIVDRLSEEGAAVVLILEFFDHRFPKATR
jgi:hypothetical protein